ncbi:hypothetical protein POL68_42315 [Stigmatella sp. ncwal1]|uniref:Uncharacterized protein n=1 Tax=Stigmatella ashevillensis TaxID=2995309 RepID=A0ABT5DNK5_9BACT|nr:hypothetical protein [Stigmatella ashevillena]MDC0715159.1 hypothetical protein [Stigmatella ashevillena]
MPLKDGDGPSRPRRPRTQAQGLVDPRRDTPRDTPSVAEPPEAPGDVLVRVRGVETLESAYEAWLELKAEHGATRARFQEERERLEQQGSFLVGAVRAAGLEPDAGAASALAPVGGEGFLGEAQARLSERRAHLERQEADAERRYQASFSEIRATLVDRIQRFLEATRPRLQLLLRKVDAQRTILHVARVGGDEAVLLCYLLAGRIPSRYGFLFDDSTEDVSLPPPALYADEGVPPEGVRPGAAQLEERLRAPGEVVPLKGFLPVFVPRPGGGETFFRLLQRGPVMEVEVAEGAAFRSLLAREEAERFAGHLLRLKLAGKIDLELEAG